jgi:hypothetical protein
VRFAERVAVAVFAWDTTTAHGPDGVRGPLVAVADPTGEETPGLVEDLTGYLPSDLAWSQLAVYSTRQWLQVRSAAVPASWAGALAQAPGTVAPGTTAVTITGVRRRAGVVDGRRTTSAAMVSFTVFVVCAPTYAICYLLRLSQLDDPLR